MKLVFPCHNYELNKKRGSCFKREVLASRLSNLLSLFPWVSAGSSKGISFDRDNWKELF